MLTNSPYPMLPVAEALDTVLTQAQPLPPQSIDLADVHGHILAQDVVAHDSLPPFPASVKDGYAVVASDGPGDYPIMGTVTAGRLADFQVEPGTVAYITTGAPLPPGADAVVMVEESERLPGEDGLQRVRLRATVEPGDDVRPVGVDVTAGQTVLTAGTRLGAAEIGLLATVGAARVEVYPRPKVAILSTGDELVEAAESPGPGQIRDSNRPTLRAAILANGCVPIDLGIAADTPGALEEQVERGLRGADVLLTSGGVSMGELDLLKPLLEARGTVHFGRLRMKPGKPLTFVTVEVDGRQKLVFALPGNPVSSLVTFYLVAVPALRKLAGWRDPHLTRVQAQLAQPLPLDPQRPEFHRATLRWDTGLNNGLAGNTGGFVATSTGSQASSRLLSMTSANALLELPMREGELAAGEVVDALLIGHI